MRENNFKDCVSSNPTEVCLVGSLMNTLTQDVEDFKTLCEKKGEKNQKMEQEKLTGR